MKKILLFAVSVFLFGCSNDDEPNNSLPTDQQQPVNKIYTNMVFLDATYEKLNTDGNQLQVLPGDAVTIFEKTTSVKITPTTFETNLITPVSYFKTGSTYSLPNLVQFSIYENSNIIIKKIEYLTSYGKDKRSERYSY